MTVDCDLVLFDLNLTLSVGWSRVCLFRKLWACCLGVVLYLCALKWL